MWFINDKTVEFCRGKIEEKKFVLIENLKLKDFIKEKLSLKLKEAGFEKDEIHIILNHLSQIHNKPGIKKQVAFVFSCPGRHEEILRRPAAKMTGKNLEILIRLLNEKNVFGYKITYEDITITNAWDKIEYEEKTGRSEADKEEILQEDNLKRLACELSQIEDIVICCGDKAYMAVRDLTLNCRIIKIRHLGMRGCNCLKKSI